MARGQGSTVSVRWGSVVVRRGRMCAVVRGASAARRKEAVGGGSRRRGFVGCICGVGWCRRWCKSEQAKSRRVDVRGDDCSRFCAAAKTGMRFGMQGMEEKKKRSFGRSGRSTVVWEIGEWGVSRKAAASHGPMRARSPTAPYHSVSALGSRSLQRRAYGELMRRGVVLNICCPKMLLPGGSS